MEKKLTSRPQSPASQETASMVGAFTRSRGFHRIARHSGLIQIAARDGKRTRSARAYVDLAWHR
jgi:hypothetical protein